MDSKKRKRIIEHDETIFSPADSKKSVRGMMIASLVVIICLSLFIGTVTIINYILNTNAVYEGVYLNNVSLEGYSKKEVEDYVNNTYVAPFYDGMISIVGPTETVNYPISDFTVCPDAKLIAAQAYNVARSGDYFARLKQIFNLKKKHLELNVVLSVKEDVIDEITKKAYNQIYVDWESPSYEIVSDGVILWGEAYNGVSVNTEKLKADIVSAVTKLQPATVTIETQAETYTKLSSDEIYNKVNKAAIDASFVANDSISGFFTVSSDTSGISISRDTLNSTINKINNGNGSPYTFITFNESPAAINEEKINSVYFNSVLAKGQTNNISTLDGTDSLKKAERDQNIENAIKKLNKVVIESQSEFNFNDFLGEVSSSSGFVDAYENAYGVIDKEMGAGISQVASAIYSAAVASNMSIIERTTYSHPVDYTGSPATECYVAQGKSNFIFKNTSYSHIMITLSYEDGIITAQILGKKNSPSITYVVTSKLSETVPFSVKYEESSFDIGVKTDGIDGYIYKTYTQKYINGVATGEPVVNTITYQKQDQVIYRGADDKYLFTLGSGQATNISNQDPLEIQNKSERDTNIKQAVSSLNSIVISAGGTFNFNQILGNVSTDKYVRAYENMPCSTTKVIGAGISQVASAIYKAALSSNMTIEQRKANDYLVSYIEPGFDAYVKQGVDNLIFTNSSEYAVKIVITYQNDIITASIMGTGTSNTIRIYSELVSTVTYESSYQDDPTSPSGTTRIKQSGVNGYIYKTYCEIKNSSGKVLSSKLISTSEYQSRNEIILRGTMGS